MSSQRAALCYACGRCDEVESLIDTRVGPQVGADALLGRMPTACAGCGNVERFSAPVVAVTSARVIVALNTGRERLRDLRGALGLAGRELGGLHGRAVLPQGSEAWIVHTVEELRALLAGSYGGFYEAPANSLLVRHWDQELVFLECLADGALEAGRPVLAFDLYGESVSLFPEIALLEEVTQKWEMVCLSAGAEAFEVEGRTGTLLEHQKRLAEEASRRCVLGGPFAPFDTKYVIVCREDRASIDQHQIERGRPSDFESAVLTLALLCWGGAVRRQLPEGRFVELGLELDMAIYREFVRQWWGKLDERERGDLDQFLFRRTGQKVRDLL